MPEIGSFFTAGAFAAFLQVVFIDLALAGDNALAVGIAAAGLPPSQRRRAVFLGLAVATVMLVGFAILTTFLLKLVGLLLAGGILLLWVCGKMWRDLRAQGREECAEGEHALTEATGIRVGRGGPRTPKPKTLRQALVQILLADLAMSVDNVLAVAAAARQHPFVLAGGLVLSITLTGLAATWIAQLLHRFKWIGYIGLAIVVYVSAQMIWDGVRLVAIDTGETGVYNEAMPDLWDIQPSEIAKRLGRRH